MRLNLAPGSSAGSGTEFDSDSGSGGGASSLAMLGSIGFKTGFNSGAAAQPEEIEHNEKSVAETRE